MINSITAFAEKDEPLEISGQLDLNSKWQLRFNIANKDDGSTIHFFFDQEMFIKLKNEILSLDRQFNERRKNATVSKRS